MLKPTHHFFQVSHMEGQDRSDTFLPYHSLPHELDLLEVLNQLLHVCIFSRYWNIQEVP